MRFEKQEPAGGEVLVSRRKSYGSEAAVKRFVPTSSSLPFGQPVPFASIDGPTYLTAQTLIQQVAYFLSDKIFSYSPESFDLDISVKDWAAAQTANAYGYPTVVSSMQTRTGAGSIALGYMFAKDFDLTKRHVPQSLLATASSLHHLRPALDQLSLLYAVANPVVAHVAAVDYAPSSNGLVTDYVSAFTTAEELGLGLVCSTSPYEVQHMSLFATLLATILPAIHIYDGVRVGRETVRVVDVLGRVGLNHVYRKVSKEISKVSRNASVEYRAGKLLEAFNNELGTTYQPFEYHGHDSPQMVIVVFGSVEASLASQVATKLSAGGSRVGVINVRVYRPFLEDAFVAMVPSSTRFVRVFGQVQSQQGVGDRAVHSSLYGDVLTALTFSAKFPAAPAIIDAKYAREEPLTPSSIAALFRRTITKSVPTEERTQLLDAGQVEQYTFWGLDDSLSAYAPSVIGTLLSRDSAKNVLLHHTYDNLIQGGSIRADIRTSKKLIEAAYPIENADVTVVGDEKLLKEIAILKNIQPGGKLIIRLPGVKDEDIEKKVPALVRSEIQQKNIQFYLLDPSLSAAVEKDASLENLLLELAFLWVARLDLFGNVLDKLAAINGSVTQLQELSVDLEYSLRQIEVPASWADVDAELKVPDLPRAINASSFVGFDKEEIEPPPVLRDWQDAAKGLVFKEAYRTKKVLKPDLPVRTHTVHVKENRRLTPKTYDRNIFHIEFDIGKSGLKYGIGEALGIHAENNKEEVHEFIKFYGLDPDEVVEVSSRESPDVLETRTVYQSLMQNIDIFGKPPKRFYEALAEFATDAKEKKELLTLGGPEGAAEFKRRAEVDTITYADVLLEFKSAHPNFHEMARIVSPMKRREYSIASSQKVNPTTVALMIVVVSWVDPRGRDRFGQATRYLSGLPIGAPVTVSVKPSVMKLPVKDTAPLIMAGLGTGLAPFRAFVQYRAMQKAQGQDIGAILLYMGSRHQREEYLYGEEWEAYQDAGVITLLGRAFSRDQPHKIYIQDRMRQTMSDIIQAYIKDKGSFYLCGPTWPVPDVTEVLQEAIARDAKAQGRKTDPKKEIDKLKDELRYVLEVY